MFSGRRKAVFRQNTLAALMLLILWPAWCEPAGADTAATVEKKVTEAIEVRQASQKAQDAWDARKARLAAEYDRLRIENEILEAESGQLSEALVSIRRSIEQLELEKTQTGQVREELQPFLKSVQEELDAFVEKDIPFLEAERRIRLEKLAALMDDPGVPVAEKFRKAMEALSIEAEYGNTLEVYPDRILMGDRQVSGQILRLGRISLYYLSLDGREAAVFDVGDQLWHRLDNRYIPAVAGAVEIALKRRTAGILDLPLGRLAIP